MGLTTTTSAQDKKISAGYKLKTYSYSFVSNQQYGPELGSMRKGFLDLGYTTDISDRFFFDISGDLLIPKNKEPISSGPLAFNAANAGISIGAHLGRFDLMAGAQGGLLWNVRVKALTPNDTYQWLRTEQPHSNFNGALSASLRYNLLDYLAITASVTRNFYQYQKLNPRPSFQATPAFTEADLSSYSAQLGLSVGVPWHAEPTHRKPTYRRGAPVIEDRRLSLSYEMRGYTYSYLPNSNYSGSLHLIKKGLLRLRYKEYLTKNFFLSGSGGYLIPSQAGSFFSAGPLNFQAANLDLLAGIRWGRISLFTGLEGGLLWNMRIKSQTSANNTEWNAPANFKSSFTAAFKAGIEYHIFKYLSVKAKFFYNSYQHANLQPDFNPSSTPAISDAELAPFSAGVGISVSLPWKSKHNRGAPPRAAPPSPSPGPVAQNQGHGQAEQNPQNGQQQEAQQQQQRELPPQVERPPESTPAKLTFIDPIPSSDIMTSYFGDQRNHEGLDINAEKGDKIVAIAHGKVKRAGWNGRYGRMVEVVHPAGFSSIYAHLSKITVEKGQKVDKGQQVGLAGNSGHSTGAHLHFELKRMDMPINPRRYIIHDWTFWKDHKK